MKSLFVLAASVLILAWLTACAQTIDQRDVSTFISPTPTPVPTYSSDK